MYRNQWCRQTTAFFRFVTHCGSLGRLVRSTATVHSQPVDPLSMNPISLMHFVINICCTRTSKIDYTAKFHFAARRYEFFFFHLSRNLRASKRESKNAQVDETGQGLSRIFCRTSSYWSSVIWIVRATTIGHNVSARIKYIRMLALANLMHAGNFAYDEIVEIIAKSSWLIQCLFLLQFQINVGCSLEIRALRNNQFQT